MTVIRTNHIVLHTDLFDLSQLLNHYQIVRYTIPDPNALFENGLVFRNELGRLKYTDKAYAMLQNLFKEQLERPYYYNSPNLTLLVMFDRQEQVPILTIPFLKNESIKPAILSTDAVANIAYQLTPGGYSQLHLLMKLMLAKFHFDYDRQHLMCQGKFFVFGKKVFIKKKPSHVVALELGLKDDYKHNRDNDPNKEYAITFEATCFLEYYQGFQNEKDEDIAYRYNYELVTDSDDLQYLRQIKRGSVKTYSSQGYVELTTPIRRKFQASGKVVPRADMAWFDAYHPFESRMPILYQFQGLFVEFLNAWGLSASVKSGLFQQYRPQIKHSDLRLDLLNNINLIDIRENKKDVDSEKYVSFMNQAASFLEANYNKKQKHKPKDYRKFNYSFNLINETELNKDIPTIVLYDCAKEAYELKAGTDGLPTGLLSRFNRSDAKQAFYQKYPNLPKHTLNVNPNSVSDFTDPQRYLTYAPLTCQLIKPEGKEKESEVKEQWKFSHADYKHRLQVVFSELFKKYFLAQEWPVYDQHYSLPCFLQFGSITKDLVFVYNFQFNEDDKHRMLMHSRNGKFEFIELTTYPQHGNKLLEPLNISLADLEVYCNNKYTKDKKGDFDKAAFIIGPNLCLEIERLDEVILYDFATISEQKRYGKDLVYHQYLWHNLADDVYFVGSPDAFNRTKPQNNAFHLYKIHKHRYDGYFDLSLLYEAMSVEFVRNRQYTVLPYFFDFIRLAKE